MPHCKVYDYCQKCTFLSCSIHLWDKSKSQTQIAICLSMNQRFVSKRNRIDGILIFPGMMFIVCFVSHAMSDMPRLNPFSRTLRKREHYNWGTFTRWGYFYLLSIFWRSSCSAISFDSSSLSFCLSMSLSDFIDITLS